MPILVMNNLPVGPCADCIQHLETESAAHTAGPLADGAFLLQLWCPHRQSLAYAFAKPGQEPAHWVIQTPVDAKRWPAMIEHVVTTRVLLQKDRAGGAGTPRRKWLPW